MYIPTTTTSNLLATNNGAITTSNATLSNVQKVSSVTDEQQVEAFTNQLSEVQTQSKFLKFLEKNGMTSATSKGATPKASPKRLSKRNIKKNGESGKTSTQTPNTKNSTTKAKDTDNLQKDPFFLATSMIFGAIGIFSAASLYACYKFIKLFLQGNVSNLTHDVIDPTVKPKNVRLGAMRKKLTRSEVNEVQEPNPATGFRMESETLCDERESVRRIFPPQEQNLMLYVRAVAPPKYKEHKYIQSEVKSSLSKAHQKRMGRLQDQLEQAQKELRSAQISYKDLQRENNPALLNAAQLIVFESEQEVERLKMQYASMMKTKACDGKILDPIHKPKDYDIVQLQSSLDHQFSKDIQDLRKEITDIVITKNQHKLNDLQMKTTKFTSQLTANDLVDADLSLLQVKENLTQMVSDEVTKQVRVQLSNKLLREKKNVLQQEIKECLADKVTPEQLTQSTLRAFSLDGFSHDQAEFRQDTKQCDITKLQQTKEYQIVPSLRLVEVKNLLASYKHILLQKQKILELPDLPFNKRQELELEIAELMIKSNDEKSALEIIKQRESQAKQAHDKLTQVLQKAQLKQNLLENISGKLTKNIKHSELGEMNLGSFTQDMQIAVNQAVKTRQDNKHHREAKIKRLQQAIAQSTDENKKQKASELLQKIEGLQNETKILQTSACKIKEENKYATYKATVGSELYNKLIADATNKK